MKHDTLVLGHRGWSRNYPENTLLSFRKALELGISGLEFDVQLTSDLVPVIIHDATLDRTTNGTGAVASVTLEQLVRFNAADRWPQYDPEPVPTLDQVLDLGSGGSRDGVFNVEIKVHTDDWKTLIDKVIDHVSTYTGTYELMFSSFHHDCLRYLKTRLPHSKIGLLYEDDASGVVQAAVDMGAHSVNLDYQLITETLVNECHSVGIKVCAWTVDEPADIQRLSSWGVDMIISNRPDTAIQTVEK